MLDIKKLNKKVIEKLINKDRIFYQNKDYKNYISDTYSIFILSDEDIYFNKEKCISNNSLDTFFDKRYSEEIELKVKNIYKDINDKNEYVVFIDENDKEYIINNKYFKYIKKYDRVYTNGNNTPIIFENNCVEIALILPIVKF